MKSSRLGFFSVLVAASLVVGLPSSMLIMSGCASKPSSEQSAYRTLHGVGVTANTAVNSWLKYYLLESAALKKAPESPDRATRLDEIIHQDLEVQKVYVSFSQAYNLALTAARMNPTNLAPAEVSLLCTQLAGLVVQFTASN